MRYLYVLLVFVITGCGSVDKNDLTAENADETSVVVDAEVKVEEAGVVQYVYLFDVLQKYPRSGLGLFEDWVIVKVENRTEKSIWSFPPVNHPAFPAAVKRQIIVQDGAVQIKTQMNCASEQVLCDQLFRDFIAMSEKVLE